MAGRSRQAFIAAEAGPFSSRLGSKSGPGVVAASAAPSPERAPQHVDRPGNKTAAPGTAWQAGILQSTPGGRRSTTPQGKKNSVGMTLAAVRVGVFSCWSFLPPFPVAAALSLPLLLAMRGLTVSLPRLPLPPPVCLVAAGLAAITSHRLLRSKDSPTALEQTGSTAGATDPSALPSDLGSSSDALILGKTWGILIRAHGSGCSQKLKPEWTSLPFGALSASLSSRTTAVLEPHD
jgi:hypothetical protein